MPIDASIPLGIQSPQTQQAQTVQTLSGLLNMKSALQAQQIQQQEMQRLQMSNQQSGIDLQETQAARQLLADPQYQNGDGTFNFAKLQGPLMAAAPKNGAAMLTNLGNAQTAFTNARAAVNTLDTQSRGIVGSGLYSVLDQSPDKRYGVAMGTLDQFEKTYPNLSPAIDLARGQLQATGGDPDKVSGVINMLAKGVLPPESQQGMSSPALGSVQTDQGTQFFNQKANVPGIPMGNVGAPVTPPNQAGTSTAGGTTLFNPATGKSTPITGGPAMDFPQGETAATQTELQNQRTAAQQAAANAPALHNLNRQIISEADTGINTGHLGAWTQKLSSITGFNIGNESSTDYNLLGKLLERSALQAAQGMGPHTNAGLEAQVRANGSTDYTPQAIRKIAALNDAMTTGSTLYQSGLEKAVQGSPNGIFAKRQFDQQWANALNPTNGVDGIQALRLKNAVDSGDQKEVQSLLSEVGGAKSAGARALYAKLQQLRSLGGQ